MDPVEISLSLSYDNLVEVNLSSSVEVRAFQIQIVDTPNSINVINVSGGSSEDSNFQLAFDQNGLVLGFSLEDLTIPPNNSILFNTEYEGIEGQVQLCINEAEIVGNGATILPVFLDDCILYSNLLGDVNLDGGIDVLDIVLIVDIIFNLFQPDPQEFWASDLSGDGEISVIDIVMVVDIILGGD